MLRFVNVSIGAGRPVACGRCHGTRTAPVFAPIQQIAAEIETAVAGWAGGPGPNIELGGPEPFAHPELPALVAAAGSSGVERIRLATDAAALASPSNAAGAIGAGVRHVSVTLLGGSPGVHDALTGAPGGFEATLDGVRSYIAAAEAQGVAVCVMAVVPVCRHNVRDVASAVGSAVQAGADSIRLVVEDGGLDMRAAIPWITAACDTGVVNGVWVEVDGVPFCLLPEHGLHCADTVRVRTGTHGPGCASCALVASCTGVVLDAAAETLALLVQPADAERLARCVSLSRGVAR